MVAQERLDGAKKPAHNRPRMNLDPEPLTSGLVIGGLATVAVAVATSMIQLFGGPDRRRVRVPAVVVGFEDRYDPSYQVMEPHPVVELVLDGRPRRSVVVSGYWKYGNAPTLKKGRAVVVYVDPESPDEVQMRIAVLPLYALALGVGLVIAAGVTFFGSSRR